MGNSPQGGKENMTGNMLPSEFSSFSSGKMCHNLPSAENEQQREDKEVSVADVLVPAMSKLCVGGGKGGCSLPLPTPFLNNPRTFAQPYPVSQDRNFYFMTCSHCHRKLILPLKDKLAGSLRSEMGKNKKASVSSAFCLLGVLHINESECSNLN